jgi:MOSC domain-containing protein YiiM
MRLRHGFMPGTRTGRRQSIMKLSSVNVGRVQSLHIGGRSVTSAIVKRAVAGPVAVNALGLEGDEQADPAVHGGLAKAVYAYPSEHYAFWRTVRAQAGVAAWDAALAPGSLGENLTLEGLTEDRAWIGDRLRFAHCVLAVSEPRRPCAKFNAAMGFVQAARLMTQSAWCGFYLAVIEPGTIDAGEPFEVLAGPREVRIDELFRATASQRCAA